MNTFRTLHRSILVLFAVVVIAIVTLVHFSISKIVAEQSRAQQQSLSPAISLIVEQLLKPLHISEALGHSTELVDLLDGETIDQQAVFKTLERLENEFGLSFFIASEDILKLNHSGICEKKRRVVVWHKRTRGHNFVPVIRKIIQKGRAYFVGARHVDNCSMALARQRNKPKTFRVLYSTVELVTLPANLAKGRF